MVRLVLRAPGIVCGSVFFFRVVPPPTRCPPPTHTHTHRCDPTGSFRPVLIVLGWTTVSEEHSIYVVDVGLTPEGCDALVTTTEQACKGRYAAYTYAKQTLGCREYPLLAEAAHGPVHSMVVAIYDKFGGAPPPKHGGTPATTTTTTTAPATKPTEAIAHSLQLDAREPHIVKYDVTKKERQKLDMHTDKSEWTFLIALSNGCGVDYEGGGTYFECLDATVHVQKGHALVFPGRLRHRGQAIHHGLRFLLVGFLIDKTGDGSAPTTAPTPTTAGGDGRPFGDDPIRAAPPLVAAA